MQEFECAPLQQLPQRSRSAWLSFQGFLCLPERVGVENDDEGLDGVVDGVVEQQIVGDGSATDQIQLSVVPEFWREHVLIELLEDLLVPEEPHGPAYSNPEGQRSQVVEPVQGLVVGQEEEGNARGKNSRF